MEKRHVVSAPVLCLCAGVCAQVRHYVYQQLALQLRPQLDAVMKATEVPPGTPYVFNAQESGRRFIRNFAESIVGSLDDPEVQEALLRRWGLGVGAVIGVQNA